MCSHLALAMGSHWHLTLHWPKYALANRGQTNAAQTAMENFSALKLKISSARQAACRQPANQAELSHAGSKHRRACWWPLNSACFYPVGKSPRDCISHNFAFSKDILQKVGMNVNVEYCKFYSYNSIQTFCSWRLVCILKCIASNPPQLLMSHPLQKRFVCREVSLVGGDIALFPLPHSWHFQVFFHHHHQIHFNKHSLLTEPHQKLSAMGFSCATKLQIIVSADLLWPTCGSPTFHQHSTLHSTTISPSGGDKWRALKLSKGQVCNAVSMIDWILVSCSLFVIRHGKSAQCWHKDPSLQSELLLVSPILSSLLLSSPLLSSSLLPTSCPPCSPCSRHCCLSGQTKWVGKMWKQTMCFASCCYHCPPHPRSPFLSELPPLWHHLSPPRPCRAWSALPRWSSPAPSPGGEGRRLLLSCFSPLPP